MTIILLRDNVISEHIFLNIKKSITCQKYWLYEKKFQMKVVEIQFSRKNSVGAHVYPPSPPNGATGLKCTETRKMRK